MQKISFTARTTAEIVRRYLADRFRSTHFEVSIDHPIEPFGPALALTGIVVRWKEGPSIDEVEEVVGKFQGLDWNPSTGVLEEIDHMEVTPEGRLLSLNYGVDYVLLDGPELDLSA
ncbi:MAG: hypothetical protein KDD65_09235 [Bacteroidetes bacterium]|nr:hypothetical protein [Bacteroidota bacterium]